MSKPHLLPCPFCGGDATHDEHDAECYFTVLRNLRAAPKGDISGALALIPAWNRRTHVDNETQRPRRKR